MARKFKDNIGLLEQDGRYFVYKVQKRLDPKFYHSHVENGKIVISKMDEEITEAELREYLLSMRETVEKLHGAEKAENVYNYNLYKFGLIDKTDQKDSIEEKKEEIEDAEIVD